MPITGENLIRPQGSSPRVDGPGALLLGTLPVSVSLASIRSAREFVRRTLGRSKVAPTCVDHATLIVSELLTNVAVHCSQHGEPEAVVNLVRVGAFLVIEVHDASPLALAYRAPSPDAESGRGLLVVDALAERWGCEATADGKCVWCELTAWPEQTASQSA